MFLDLGEVHWQGYFHELPELSFAVCFSRSRILIDLGLFCHFPVALNAFLILRESFIEQGVQIVGCVLLEHRLEPQTAKSEQSNLNAAQQRKDFSGGQYEVITQDFTHSAVEVEHRLLVPLREYYPKVLIQVPDGFEDEGL